MDKIMNMVSWPLAKDTDPRPKEREGPGPFRVRSELEKEERAYQRQAALAVQRSELNPPDVRIRAWEKLHGLRLPSDSAHPILEVIAVGTRLTLAEVQAEQCARASRRAAPVETEKSSDTLSTSDGALPVNPNRF
jgi:hypothetical protein